LRREFSDKRLERLYTKGEGAPKYPEAVVEAFLKRVRHIEGARDERDLRVPRSVHYEKLKGKFAGKDSMKLNDQWRLILEVREDQLGKVVWIEEINNHYGD